MGFPYFGNAIDFGFLPPGVNGDVQVFYAPANATTQWQQWVKPRGVTTTFMLLIGGGGGGGGGLTGVASSARGGGGGGACSCIATHLFPTYILPDVLKVSVGLGGAGSTGSGVAGTAGTNSYVAMGVGLTAGATIPNVIAQSGINAPGGGAAGTGAGNAAGGTVPSIATKAGQGWAQVYSFSTFTVGIVGSTGGVATGGSGTAIGVSWNLIPVTPGTGGSGTSGANFTTGPISLQAAMDFADGNCAPSASYIQGGAGAAGQPGSSGNHGVQVFRPLVMTGGTGGASSDGQAGGNGADGAIGCGGGGGGGGATGGTGGNGGAGIVICISW